MSYKYNLRIACSNRKQKLTDEMIELITRASERACLSTNSKRFKRSFHVLERIDDYSLLVEVVSEHPIEKPTSTVSSITRSLIQICPDDKIDVLNLLKYNNSFLVASLVPNKSDTEKDSGSLKLIKTIIDIIQNEEEDELASEAATKIRTIVSEYAEKASHREK